MKFVFFIICALGALAPMGAIMVCTAEFVRNMVELIYERDIQTIQLARIIDDMTHCSPAFGYGVLMGMGYISKSDWPNLEKALRVPPGTIERCYEQLQKMNE